MASTTRTEAASAACRSSITQRTGRAAHSAESHASHAASTAEACGVTPRDDIDVSASAPRTATARSASASERRRPRCSTSLRRRAGPGSPGRSPAARRSVSAITPKGSAGRPSMRPRARRISSAASRSVSRSSSARARRDLPTPAGPVTSTAPAQPSLTVASSAPSSSASSRSLPTQGVPSSGGTGSSPPPARAPSSCAPPSQGETEKEEPADSARAVATSRWMRPQGVAARSRRPRSMRSPSSRRPDAGARPATMQTGTPWAPARRASAQRAARSAREGASARPQTVATTELPAASFHAGAVGLEEAPEVRQRALRRDGGGRDRPRARGGAREDDADEAHLPEPEGAGRRLAGGAPLADRAGRGARRGRGLRPGRRLDLAGEDVAHAQGARRELGAVGGAVVRVLREHAVDEVVEGLGGVGLQGADAGDVVLEDLGGDLHRVRPQEGRAPSQALEEHAPEREHVGARVHLGAALELLRRHVPRGPEEHARPREPRGLGRVARDPEVDHLGERHVASGQEEVLRLEVAVDDAARVRVGQGVRRAADDRERLLHGEPLAREARGEVLALEPFHGEVAHAARRRRGPRSGRCRGARARRGSSPRGRSAPPPPRHRRRGAPSRRRRGRRGGQLHGRPGPCRRTRPLGRGQNDRRERPRPSRSPPVRNMPKGCARGNLECSSGSLRCVRRRWNPAWLCSARTVPLRTRARPPARWSASTSAPRSRPGRGAAPGAAEGSSGCRRR